MFISMGKIEFKCPHCGKKYDDSDDKYLKKCNKNKSSCATVKCSCNNKFNVTYNMMGDIVAFKSDNNNSKNKLKTKNKENG